MEKKYSAKDLYIVKIYQITDIKPKGLLNDIVVYTPYCIAIAKRKSNDIQTSYNLITKGLKIGDVYDAHNVGDLFVKSAHPIGIMPNVNIHTKYTFAQIEEMEYILNHRLKNETTTSNDENNNKSL